MIALFLVLFALWGGYKVATHFDLEHMRTGLKPGDYVVFYRGELKEVGYIKCIEGDNYTITWCGEDYVLTRKQIF